MSFGGSLRIAGSAVRVVPALAEAIKRRKAAARHAADAREILGIGREQANSYRVSMQHPHLAPGVPHADDLAAFRVMAGPAVLNAIIDGSVEYVDDIDVPLSDGLVLIGSPESESLTRLIFGYRARADGNGMEYVGDVLDLPFRWEEDGTKISAECMRYVPLGATSRRPNWPIIRTVKGARTSLYPPVERSGWLERDFLLISKIPNFLTEESQQSGRHIVSIGGTHGVGTRSIERVLSDPECVERISSELAHQDAFQILVEARSIQHDRVTGSQAKSVRIREIRKLRLSDADLSHARAAVQQRYAEWFEASDWVVLRNHQQVRETEYLY